MKKYYQLITLVFLLMTYCFAWAEIELDVQKITNYNSVSDRKAYFGRKVVVSGNYFIATATGYPGGWGNGLVYIYKFSNNQWHFHQLLENITPLSLSVYENDFIIGDSNKQEVYIYTNNGSTWKWQITITDNDQITEGRFGNSVSIYKNWAIIGSHKEEVFVYFRNNGKWNYHSSITCSDSGIRFFGKNVCINNSYLFVGAEEWNRDCAYIFKIENDQFIQKQKLTNLGKNGYTIHIEENYAIIGTTNTGQAYKSYEANIYKLEGEEWILKQKLSALEQEDSDFFASSVALYGQFAIVGAWGNCGSAYIFKNEDETWINWIKLTPDDFQEDKRFGISVSINANSILVGSSWDSEKAEHSGAVYVYDVLSISTIPNQTINEDHSTDQIQFTIHDFVDSFDELILTGQSDNELLVPNDSDHIHFSGNGIDRTMVITPQTNQNGMATITLTLDNSIRSVSKSFTLVVNEINDCPEFTLSHSYVSREEDFTDAISISAIPLQIPDDEQNQTFVYTIEPETVDFVNLIIDPDSGNITITSVPNKNGRQTFYVTANDGQSISNTYTASFTLCITPVNDIPTISTIPNISIYEDTQFKDILLDGITSGADNEIQHITLTCKSSTPEIIPHPFVKYTSQSAVGTITLYPYENQFGLITMTVQVNDGQQYHNVFTRTFFVDILPINDPPSFLKGSNLEILEDSETHIFNQWASNVVSGPENESSQQIAFHIDATNNHLFMPGKGPTILDDGTLSFTCKPDQYGTSNISVYLTDDGGIENNGNHRSSTQIFMITIIPVNDPPSFIKGENQVILEDAENQVISEWATNILKGPDNEDSQDIIFQIQLDHHDFFSVIPKVFIDGTLTYTPFPNINGIINVTVSLTDNAGTNYGGSNTSSFQEFTIRILPVNDPPVFSKGNDIVIYEDTGLQVTQMWATNISPGPDDEKGQMLQFLCDSDNDQLFEQNSQPHITADGTLIFTPATDAFGKTFILVSLKDNGGLDNNGEDTSSDQQFSITIENINDPPSFQPGDYIEINEDSGTHMISEWAGNIIKGPSNENTQSIIFKTSTSEKNLFTLMPTVSIDGTLTFKPANNANGLATFTIYLQDDGGTTMGGNDKSPEYQCQISIKPVNDPPDCTLGTEITVHEDADLQIIPHFVSEIYAGPEDEYSQAVSFTIVNISDPDLFMTANQPKLLSNGTLSFRPQPDSFGSSTIDFYLQDNGGKKNGGNDRSDIKEFQIEIQPINDPPQFIKGPDIEIMEDSEPQTFQNWATQISPGNEKESNQIIKFHVNTDNDMLFQELPSISTEGDLTFTPAPDASGTANVTLYLTDSGGTLNQGIDESTSQTMSINIQPLDEVKAIIIAGGGNEFDPLSHITLFCANYAYKSLLYQGYEKKNIYYAANIDRETDIDGNGKNDDIVENPSIENFKNVVQDWANDAHTLLLYLVDHGGHQTFRINERETITAQEIDSWLDQLQNTIKGRVIIIYDACQSGSFITACIPTPGKERIFIASSTSEDNAKFLENGLLSFSYQFWASVFNGVSLLDAFYAGKNVMKHYQNAQIDYNGNGIPNEKKDYLLMANQIINIGHGKKTGADIPIIQEVIPSITLQGEMSVTLWANGISDADGISNVWASISPPQLFDNSPEQPVLSLPKVQLSDPDQDGQYTGIYDSFRIQGIYAISFYAMDTQGFFSPPKQSQIIQNKGVIFHEGDINQDKKTDILDAVLVLKILAGSEDTGENNINFSNYIFLDDSNTLGLEDVIYTMKKIGE